jgi:hypothetical protein
MYVVVMVERSKKARDQLLILFSSVGNKNGFLEAAAAHAK